MPTFAWEWTATPEPTATLAPTVVPTPTPAPPLPETPSVSAESGGASEVVAEVPAPSAAATAIDRYLVGTPLSGQGAAMAGAAARHGIDWRMLPAISLYESTWGRNACGFNPYGWGSCRLDNFGSWEEAHEVAASTLASYGGDDFWKLCVWNQGATGCRNGLGHDYAGKVLAEMATLGQ